MSDRNLFSLISLILAVVMLPYSASARMASLGDEELSSITAQSGVSIAIEEGLARFSFDSWFIEDSSHGLSLPNYATDELWLSGDGNMNRIMFKNLVIDDGAGGYFSFATAGGPITFDVGTSPNPYNAGQTVISMDLTSNTHPRYISIGNFVFCGQDIGSLALDHITENDQHLFIGPHGGIDFEYTTRMDIGALKYTYSSTPGGSLLFSGIHLCQTPQGAPNDPASWTFSGPFKIGDLAGNNPATMDVGTNSAEEGGKTVLRLNVPMQGSLRVGNVSFGANNFGPCAIDGINVHRLSIDLVPGL